MHQDINANIDKALTSRDFSVAKNAFEYFGDFTELQEIHSAPFLKTYQNSGGFYHVLMKFVSQHLYETVVMFLKELQKMPNGELFISDEIFLCGVACQYTIDPNGWFDKCLGLVQDRILRSPDLYQHFDTLMLCDPEYTEFYRPIAHFLIKRTSCFKRQLTDSVFFRRGDGDFRNLDQTGALFNDLNRIEVQAGRCRSQIFKFTRSN